MVTLLTTLWNNILYYPFLNALFALYHLFGNNLGWAVVILAIVVRLVLIPSTKRQMTMTRKMSTLKPKLDEINAKYANNKEKLAQEQMKLYRQEKYNPLGCFGSFVVQMVILFVMVAVIRVVAAVTTPIDKAVYSTSESTITINYEEKLSPAKNDILRYASDSAEYRFYNSAGEEYSIYLPKFNGTEWELADGQTYKPETDKELVIKVDKLYVKKDDSLVEVTDGTDLKDYFKIARHVDGLYSSVSGWIYGDSTEQVVNTSFLNIDLAKNFSSIVKSCNCIPFKDQLLNIPYNIAMIILGPIKVPQSIPYVILAIIVGIIQYFTTLVMQNVQGTVNPSATPKKKKGAEAMSPEEMQAEMMKSMNLMFPIMTVLISVGTPAVLSIYWLAQSFMSIVQYFIIDKERTVTYFKKIFKL